MLLSKLKTLISATATGECPNILDAAGVSQMYSPMIAHSIHSLTLEDIRYFFEEDATEENGIPTGRINCTCFFHYKSLLAMFLTCWLEILLAKVFISEMFNVSDPYLNFSEHGLEEWNEGPAQCSPSWIRWWFLHKEHENSWSGGLNL